MTAHLYARVSTIIQVQEGFSLAAQSERMRAYCAYQGWGEIQYWEDAGISGKRDDRPALVAMLKSLRRGDVVVVYSLSRLGRGGAVQTLQIVDRIRKAGARLVSLTENIDTESATGRLMLTILAALAELESETTKERSQQGRIQAAREGKIPLGPTAMPFGYSRDAEGRPVPNERAEDAKLIFRMKRDRGVQTLAKDLNEMGIPTRTGQGKWSTNVLHNIITNPAYKGEGLFRAGKGSKEQDGNIMVPFPALVTSEEWQAAQFGARLNPHFGNRAPDLYPLTGHLVCPCGVKMSGRFQKIQRKTMMYEQRAYFVSNHQKIAHGCKCKTGVKADEVEARARQLLASTLQNPEDPAALWALSGTPAEDPYAAERQSLHDMLEALLDLYLSKELPKDKYLQRKQGIEDRLHQLPQPERPKPLLNLPGMKAAAEAVRVCNALELADLLDLFQVKIQVQTKTCEVTLLEFTPLSQDEDDLAFV